MHGFSRRASNPLLRGPSARLYHNARIVWRPPELKITEFYFDSIKTFETPVPKTFPRFRPLSCFPTSLYPLPCHKFGKDNQFGYINKQGNYLIKPQYELSGDYREGLIPVEIGGKDEKIGERSYKHISGKWGFMDSLGKVVIAPKYNGADEFSEGLAQVTVGDKYGYIDKTGAIIISPQFKYSSNAYQCANFVEGRACFERDDKIGFIDKKGNVVIEPKFENVTEFSGGVAQVNFGHLPNSADERFPIYDNYGLIDRSGKVIYKPTNKPTKPAHVSELVDESKYKGWKKLEEETFSFYAPKEVIGGKQQGIDSQIYRYEGFGLTVYFDIGMYRLGSRVVDSAVKTTIDGLDASITQSVGSSGLEVLLGDNYNKTYFSINISYKNQTQKDITEKIFRSLRFK